MDYKRDEAKQIKIYKKIYKFWPRAQKNAYSFANMANKRNKERENCAAELDSQSHLRKLRSKPRASKCSSKISSETPVKPQEKKE